jgi:hypothetical protein
MRKCVLKKTWDMNANKQRIPTIHTFPNLFIITNNYIANRLIPQLMSYKAMGHFGQESNLSMCMEIQKGLKGKVGLRILA